MSGSPHWFERVKEFFGVWAFGFCSCESCDWAQGYMKTWRSQTGRAPGLPESVLKSIVAWGLCYLCHIRSNGVESCPS